MKNIIKGCFNYFFVKNKKITFIILSFLIPLFVYTSIFFIKELFTNKTIIQGDMAAQYYPLFVYFKGFFSGTNSIFYSFSKCLGGTMFGTFFYYMSSPLNLLLFFVSKENISQFINFLVILKLSLCGLTMYLYMRKKYKKDCFSILVFSLLYAFMGYNLNYYINIMWFDVVFLAPLVLLGVERIIEDKSPLFYIFLLVICIISNYYIAYMLCVFCILYFIFEVLLRYDLKKDKKMVKKIFIKFFISSLLSGLMCSFFMVPCIFEVMNYGRRIKINELFVFDYNFFNIFSKTYIKSTNLQNVLNDNCINIYCGVIVFPLIYLFLTNNKISKKERFFTLCFLLLMIFPCFIKIFNYFWHLFSIPFFYNYRYSFLLSFFLINIAYKSLFNLNVNKKKLVLYYILYLIISIYLLIIINITNHYFFLSNIFIVVTLILLLVYFLLLLHQKNNFMVKRFLFLFIMIESIVNVYLVMCDNVYGEKIQNKYDNVVSEYSGENVIEIYDELSHFNNSLIYNYRGINTFLSTDNSRLIGFLSKVGLNKKDFTNYYLSNYESPIIEKILGVDTFISDEENDFLKLYNDEKVIDDFYIYQNKGSFDFGYIIKNDCNGLDFEFPFDQKMFNCVFNTNNVYYKEVVPNEEWKFKLKKNIPYYVVSSEYSKLLENYTDNIIYDSFDYSIVFFKEDFELVFDDVKEQLKIYYFDFDMFNRTFKKVKIENLESSISDNKLFGRINTAGGTLMITLPYEKGFKVYVDSKQVDYKVVLDTFIGIDLEKGEHEIVVEYEQPGLKIGISISIISFLFTMLFLKKWKRDMNE